MKPATRNFILVFILLCALGVGISFIPVAHVSTTASAEVSVEGESHQ
jgi:hypothetical protein